MDETCPTPTPKNIYRIHSLHELLAMALPKTSREGHGGSRIGVFTWYFLVIFFVSVISPQLKTQAGYGDGQMLIDMVGPWLHF